MRSLLIGLIGLLSLAISPASAADAATQEANKKAVLEFYDAALNRKDFDAAAKFFGPHYIQHNPTAPDGIEGFKAFLGFLREKFPDSRSEIKRAFADGDYVIIKKTREAQSGQIVVAQTDDGEATLKRWYPEANRIRLEPANRSMRAIYVKDAKVLGVLIGVVRNMA